MAKSTHASGPSITDEEAADPDQTTPAIRFSRPELGLIDQPINPDAGNIAFDEDPANAKNSSAAHAGDSGTVVTGEDSIRARQEARDNESDEFDEEEEEESSFSNPADGGDFSASSKSETQSSESSTADPLSPALTTENLSNQPETEPDSSASSTATDGLSKRQTPSSRARKATPAKRANPRAARVRSTDDEFDI